MKKYKLYSHIKRSTKKLLILQSVCYLPTWTLTTARHDIYLFINFLKVPKKILLKFYLEFLGILLKVFFGELKNLSIDKCHEKMH